MNIISREFKAYRKQLFFWCLGVIFLIASGMAKYSALSIDSATMNQLTDSLPKAVLAVIGLSNFDLTKFSGYYGVIHFYLMMVMFAHAIMLGTDIILKEERDKTAEFLLTKPVSRLHIVVRKMVVAVLQLVFLNVCQLLATVVSMVVMQPATTFYGELLISSLLLFLCQMVYLFFGSLIASVWKNHRHSIHISLLCFLSTYVFAVVYDIDDTLFFLRILTPFRYFPIQPILEGSGFSFMFVGLSVLEIIVLAWISLRCYQKRDLMI